MKTRLANVSILSLILIGLLMACSPYVQTIVPESEKPTFFRLSPNRHKMLYRGGSAGRYYVLDLDTRKTISLFEVSTKVHWENIGWVDDRYLYEAGLVIDTETWEVQPLAAFSPAEQARIEADWERRRDSLEFIKQYNTPYLAPNGQYYFIGFEHALLIYTAEGREIRQYETKCFIEQMEWAHDSSGVYLQLEHSGPLLSGMAPGPIVKVLVPQ